MVPSRRGKAAMAAMGVLLSSTGTAAHDAGHETMPGMNVKRLAAIDMHGTRGTTRRRRIILAEFTAGLAVMVALGIWLVTSASSLGTRILGAWLIGAGLNYAPLAGYAILLSRPGALDTELAGVDTGRELRRYGTRQLWILVPLSLIAFAVIPSERKTGA
jgi:hypothetical protein